jgi:hypothetical protein
MMTDERQIDMNLTDLQKCWLFERTAKGWVMKCEVKLGDSGQMMIGGRALGHIDEGGSIGATMLFSRGLFELLRRHGRAVRRSEPYLPPSWWTLVMPIRSRLKMGRFRLLPQAP